MSRPTYVAGLDLGQQQDYTALVIVELTARPHPDHPAQTEPMFGVRHLYRWPLGTPYPTIVAELREMCGQAAELHRATLVVDQTGVGRAVVDMLRDARLPIYVTPYTITSGAEAGPGTVPKKDLVGAVQAALQTRRLKFAGSLDLTETLAAELEQFRVKVTLARNEVFESWRERDHDDLVLALALAVWYAGRHAGTGNPASYVPSAKAVADARRMKEWFPTRPSFGPHPRG